MTILLMRHGEAEVLARSDFDRKLTDRGRQQAQGVATKLIEGGYSADLLFSSPYPRAVETADIVAAKLGLPAVSENELVPDGDPKIVIDFLDRNVNTSIESKMNVMAVTHQPLVSRLIKLLTGEDVPMKTANVAVIEAESIVAGFGELKCIL